MVTSPTEASPIQASPTSLSKRLVAGATTSATTGWKLLRLLRRIGQWSQWILSRGSWIDLSRGDPSTGLSTQASSTELILSGGSRIDLPSGDPSSRPLLSTRAMGSSKE